MATCEAISVRGADGAALCARLWLPDQPVGAVLYLHGIQSHGGWFEASGQRLADEGFAVLLPDRRGSGRNADPRGHARSAQQLVDDAVAHADHLNKLVPLPRIHLLGISWGAKLALATVDRLADRVASLSLVGPGLFPSVDLSFRSKVAVALSLAARPLKTFEIPLNDPAMFTATPRWRDFIASDPLRLTRVTASFLFASRQLDRMARAAAGRSRLCPMHVFLAGHDRIIDNEHTRRFFRQLRSPQRFITEFPHAEHTLEFEDSSSPYLDALADWLTTNGRANDRGRPEVDFGS